MAEDTTTSSNGDVTDSSKGAIIPTADGGITLDNGSEKRDPIPSPVENRDSVRNADDAHSADDATAGEVIDYEALAKSGWQVGNFDSSTGAGGDVLSNLAYPSEKAVRAERAALAQNQGKESLIGGAENDPSTVAEESGVRAGVLEDESGKAEGDLTPQEKRARTLRLKKEEEERKAAEAKGAPEPLAPALGDDSK